MKFDPFAWKEEKPNEIKVKPGRVLLRLSAPCAVYCSAHGVESLLGHGAEISAEMATKATLSVSGPEGVRVFRHVPDRSVSEDKSETFANPDRMTQESGTLLEVRRAMRDLEIQRKSILRELREAGQAAKKPAPEPEPAPEGVPEGAAE